MAQLANSPATAYASGKCVTYSNAAGCSLAQVSVGIAHEHSCIDLLQPLVAPELPLQRSAGSGYILIYDFFQPPFGKDICIASSVLITHWGEIESTNSIFVRTFLRRIPPVSVKQLRTSIFVDANIRNESKPASWVTRCQATNEAGMRVTAIT